MFNPSRLTLARKRRQLNGRELANLADITPEHLSRIEKGEAAESLDPSTVKSLANALDFPMEFFSGDDLDIPNTSTASFRSLSSMSAKERDAALSAGGVAHIISNWVSENFNLPEPDLPDYRHESDPSSAAQALRTYWGLGERPISNVVRLLESKGVRVFSLAENTRNIDAFSFWRNGIPYIFLNSIKTAERSRFDGMHELGHLVLHRHGVPQGRKQEREADNFASHFLIPSMDLIANMPSAKTLDQLIAAKERWKVSLSALTYRLHKAGLITDWQYRTFCIQINKRFGQSEPNGIAREKSVVWEKIFRELWRDKITREQVAEELHIPLAELDGLVFNILDDDSASRLQAGTEGFKLGLV